MKTLLWQSRLEYLARRRNGYLVLACGSILLNFVLAGVIAFTANHERIILVPPEIERPLSVTSVRVSPEYLSTMSLFLSDLLLNITPDNAAAQHKLFLDYVDSRFYGGMKSELATEEERLRKEHLTVSFSRSDVQVDTKHLAARISGTVEYRANTTLLSSTRLTYQMTFRWHLGQLRVKSFEEVRKGNTSV